MYQKVNGVELYYEKAGQGQPIILLHGNGGSHRLFHKFIKLLEANYKVYAIDSRDHGLSTKVEELDYRTMAEDIAEFIRALEIEKPILYGFSDGGILGLLIASKYPELLSKLIISGANLNPGGIVRKWDRLFRALYRITKNRKILLMNTQPDISLEELHRITIPTLVLAGSRDMITREHTQLIADNIKGSTLNILKGEGHTSYVINHKKLYKILKINNFITEVND